MLSSDKMARIAAATDGMGGDGRAGKVVFDPHPIPLYSTYRRMSTNILILLQLL
jgi:hypothetical protein